MVNSHVVQAFFLAITLSFLLSAKVHAVTSAKDFGTLPQIYDAALSPNGEEVAILGSSDGRHIIRVVSFSNPKAKDRMIALGPEMKPKYLKWANEKRIILSFWQSEILDHVPIRTGYLYSLDTKSMKGKILVNPVKSDGVTEFKFRQFNNVIVDWLDDDPNHILMSYGDENNRQPDIYRVNVKTGREKILKRGLNNVQKWHTDQTGEPRVGQGRNEKNGDWVLRIRDADSDKWRSSKDFPDLAAETKIYGFTSNPNQLIISSHQGRDTAGLYIYDLTEKKITEQLYHNDTYDATGVVFSSNSGNVIGARYVAESPQTEFIGKHASLMSRMRSLFKNSVVEYVDRSREGSKYLIKVSNATDPGNLLVVERKQKPINLGRLRPHINPKDLGAVIDIEYNARDGQAIPSFLTIPPTITGIEQLQELPFIVLPHGGPHARTSKRFDYFAQFFASQGYGVLQMNFRGSTGYGKKFEASGRENWVVMQEDVEDGTRWLISQGLADPKRVCIAGWSYGGYAALMGGAKNSDLYSCVISIAGVTDIKAHTNSKKQYRFGRHHAKSMLAGFKNKHAVKENSPVQLAKQIKAPAFLSHGTSDEVVHFDQFNRMKSALKDSGATTTFLASKDADHYFSSQNNRQGLLSSLELFLEKVNGRSEFKNAAK